MYLDHRTWVSRITCRSQNSGQLSGNSMEAFMKTIIPLPAAAQPAHVTPKPRPAHPSPSRQPVYDIQYIGSLQRYGTQTE